MTFHAVVAGWEVDFLVDVSPVVVETDGWSSHGLDREQFERDRRKDADLRAAGFVVCRYSWTQVTRQSRWLADNLRAVLRNSVPARF
jgi:very-short-patch-repair endonuclease